MTTPAAPPAPGQLAARARQVRFTAVLDVTATAVLTAIGWVFGTLWFGLVISAMYCAAPLSWGFRAGARRPQPDEKPLLPPGSEIRPG